MTQLSNSIINAVADLKPGYTLGAADVALLQEMARRLLAVEGQEPGEYLTHVVDDGVGEYSDRMNFSLPIGTKLYAAPQPTPVAQPVQVPDVVPANVREKIVSLGSDYVLGDIDETPLAQAVWEACRAAMLKGDKS